MRVWVALGLGIVGQDSKIKFCELHLSDKPNNWHSNVNV